MLSYKDKILFSKSKVSTKKGIKRILGKPEVSKILNNHREIADMGKKLIEKKDGGISKKEMGDILRDFYNNKNDSLDKQEVLRLTKAFGMGDMKKYVRNGKVVDKNIDTNRSEEVLERIKKEKALGKGNSNSFKTNRSFPRVKF